MGLAALGVVVGSPLAPWAAAPPDARAIVAAAIDYWRDTSSRSRVEMIIHRPDWERRVVLEVWTQGRDRSLVRVIAPPRDAGTATLLLDGKMWTYTPKVDRLIKLPASMMHQSWLGSDFTNNDVARSADIVDQYHHRLLGTERAGDHQVYRIESVPREAAPVVWGKEVMRIRDDHILLQHDFYDQAGVLVKRLTTRDIRPLGGKRIATVERMARMDESGRWTEVRVLAARFGVAVPPETFTLSNLRNPRF